MKHVKTTVIAILAVIVAAIPAIFADPSFAHYIAQHPWAATYLPLVSGVIAAIAHAVRDNAGART